jgi:subtilisin family serine protease
MNLRPIRVALVLAAMPMLSLAFTGPGPDTLDDWHLRDAQTHGHHGISLQKALDLVKDRKPAKVRVAIIDSGIDVNHEDLKGNVWVNAKEVAGNGKDDDGNGYVDDLNGWNFMGRADGTNLEHANLELTRLFRKLAPQMGQYADLKSVPKERQADWKKFKEMEAKIQKELTEANGEMMQLTGLSVFYAKADSVFVSMFGDSYTAEQVAAVKSDDKKVQQMQAFMLQMLGQDLTKANLKKYMDYLEGKLKYNYNPEFVDRAILGDDTDDFSGFRYGNGNVAAPQADHGTHVAGIVGAMRGNRLGIEGIANNVEIMAIRAVPNGDEFDKDIAGAIRYAADNGARIINMSFGKSYSAHPDKVHEAIRYAEQKGVLMIHAAGNDSENLDKAMNYPHPYYSFQKAPCSTWLTIGASSGTGSADFVGSFSNYGKKTVDVFAPGVQIYSLKPANTYEHESGTSMAAPVTTGIAALVLSYFPNLTAAQLKEIILNSSVKYPKLKVTLPGTEDKLVPFKNLSRTGGVVNAYEAMKKAMAY